MNIHPAIVHFPIALLIVYALMECIRFNRVISHRSWKDIKAVFVILGTVFGFMALQTGEIAEHAYDGGSDARQLIEIHSTFAGMSVWVFAVLAVAYLVMFATEQIPSLAAKSWWRNIEKLSIFIRQPLVSIILALIGLITITITGALGGALTYGPETDPVASFIYHLFF